MHTCTKCVIKMLRFKINIPCMVCRPTGTQTQTSHLQINMYRQMDAVINYGNKSFRFILYYYYYHYYYYYY
jgi:hypothetical protein